MSQTLSKICPKALTATCDEYDGFEPAKKCVTFHGSLCQQNKPKFCGQCGHHEGTCRIGYTAKASSKACRHALSRLSLYRSGY